MLAERLPVERMDPRAAVLTEAFPAEQTYRVDCATCRASFDALAAEWCHCVSSEATLVCPNCDTCFCKAGITYSRYFWSAAPRGLRLARYRQAPADAVATVDPAPGPRIRPLVLLVDDESVIRHLATHVISKMGYEVIAATNGADGSRQSPVPNDVGSPTRRPGRNSRRE